MRQGIESLIRTDDMLCQLGQDQAPRRRLLDLRITLGPR
jgi:hypothetical protein